MIIDFHLGGIDTVILLKRSDVQLRKFQLEIYLFNSDNKKKNSTKNGKCPFKADKALKTSQLIMLLKMCNLK